MEIVFRQGWNSILLTCIHEYVFYFETLYKDYLFFLKENLLKTLRLLKMNLESIINNKCIYIINTLCIILYGCNQVNFLFNLVIPFKKFNFPHSLFSFSSCVFWLEKPAVFMATKILAAAQNQFSDMQPLNPPNPALPETLILALKWTLFKIQKTIQSLKNCDPRAFCHTSSQFWRKEEKPGKHFCLCAAEN